MAVPVSFRHDASNALRCEVCHRFSEQGGFFIASAEGMDTLKHSAFSGKYDAQNNSNSMQHQPCVVVTPPCPPTTLALSVVLLIGVVIVIIMTIGSDDTE